MDKPAIGQRTGFRFSLKLLLLSVVPVSLIAAAFESATSTWAAAATTSTLLALFAAVVAAAFDVRRRRPIWFGFAVCGGGYLLALLIAPSGLSETFATEQVNQSLLETLHPGATYPIDVPSFPAINEAPKSHRSLLASGNAEQSLRRLVSFVDAAWRQGGIESLITMVDTPADGNLPASPTIAEAPATSAGAPTNTEILTEMQIAESILTATNFKVIARCAWIWLVGACGACLAFCLASRSTVDRKDYDAISDGAAIKGTRSRHLQAAAVSVAIVMVGVLYCGFASWNPGRAWPCAAMSAAAIGTLGFAICAVFGSLQRRPYRAGFAICCGGYFLFSSFADPTQARDTGLNHFMRATAASRALGVVYDRWFTAYFPHSLDPPSPGGSSDITPLPDIEANFDITAHGLVALFLGSLGGGLAQFLVLRRLRITVADSAVPRHAKLGAFDAID